MRIKQLWSCLAVAAVAFLALESQAQTLISRSQLRRTADPSQRSATGQVILKVDTKGTQTMQTDIRGLCNECSFGLFSAPYPSFSTNCCTEAIAPLGLDNAKKGAWSRRLTGNGSAPPELQNDGIANLSDLAGTRADIAKPERDNLILTITNVVEGVTNIVTGIPVPTPNVTNVVAVILWAPLYAPTVDPGAGSYLRKGTMIPLAVAPPSPGAKGTIAVRFKGTLGESVFDVKASKLTPGQVYHVYIADSTNQNTFVLIDAGTMTTSKSGSTARFLRDTRFGDPLPQQVRDAGDLSGRIIEIRDDFGIFIHLQGIVP